MSVTKQEYERKYYRDHRTKILERDRQLNSRFNHLWGTIGKCSEYAPIIRQSEVYVAEQILPQLGFTEIMLIHGYLSHFFVDILAKKDGAEYGIDVTLSPNKQLTKGKCLIARHLNMRLLICHLKPDFSRYFLIEPKPNIMSTHCRGAFLEYISPPKSAQEVKEHHKQAIKDWKNRNPEKVKAQKHRYYLRHRERIRLQRHEWYLRKIPDCSIYTPKKMESAYAF